MSCLTKEPAYSSYTNIRACVDYIFYDDGERGEQGREAQPKLIDLVRVLDMPSYSMFLKGNVQSLPHALMPSDHLSMLAEFVIL
jgi:mRNA deadenylase 3'-5' endonuclease subunit Ccr4